MAPYEALYGRKCRTSLCWDKVGERKLEDVELIKATSKKVKIIWERLKAAQDRRKSYADTRKRVLEYEVGDMVFLKVVSWKGVIRFQKRGKLITRYIRPFRILKDWTSSLSFGITTRLGTHPWCFSCFYVKKVYIGSISCLENPTSRA